MGLKSCPCVLRVDCINGCIARIPYSCTCFAVDMRTCSYSYSSLYTSVLWLAFPNYAVLSLVIIDLTLLHATVTALNCAPIENFAALIR